MRNPVCEARYEIDVTYRCNQNCKWCNRMVSELGPLNRPDVTLEDVEVAGRLLADFRVQVLRVKLCGGEPVLHKQLAGVCSIATRLWTEGRVYVMTSGELDLPKLPERTLYKISPSHGHGTFHTPFAVSPHDLGIRSTEGFLRTCRPQKLCGRAFDAYGFAFCPFAGVIGSMVGIDPYQPYPAMEGWPSICRHCIYSINPYVRSRVFEGCKRGEIACPSATFRKGVERCKQNPPKWPLFSERLNR